MNLERLSEIQAAATFTAVCGGVMQVNGFSASDAGTQTLYAGSLTDAQFALGGAARRD